MDVRVICREFSRSMTHRKDLAARQTSRNVGRWLHEIFKQWRSQAEQSKERAKQAKISYGRILEQKRNNSFRIWKEHAEATSVLLAEVSS